MSAQSSQLVPYFYMNVTDEKRQRANWTKFHMLVKLSLVVVVVPCCD